MPELVETVIVGGGQAGLAMSHYLQQHGCEHLILERGRIAERWRSERWDSLHFQFPNWMMRLPGYAYPGADRDGFMHRNGVTDFIASYAVRIAAPVRCGVNVNALRLTDSGRFRVEAGRMTMDAINVVVATGPYQSPRIPEAAARMPAGIYQITANRYTSPSELPPGGVLVVGSGGSGCQIVEDLLLHGRSVHFTLRGHRRVPRRYRGCDFGHWNEEMGLTDRTVDQIPSGFRPPLLTGFGGGHTVDIRGMATLGATLLGDRLYNLARPDFEWSKTIRRSELRDLGFAGGKAGLNLHRVPSTGGASDGGADGPMQGSPSPDGARGVRDDPRRPAVPDQRLRPSVPDPAGRRGVRTQDPGTGGQAGPQRRR